MDINPKDIYTFDDLNKVIASKQISTDIIIREGSIKTLGEIEIANGLLGFCDSIIESLGQLKEVKGDFFISIHTVHSNLKSLDNLETVQGDLSLRYSNVENLGALKRVGGKMNIRDTNISCLGQLEFVGGDLYLPKKIESKINLSNITINGEVRFWNDSKNKKNIIPKSKIGYTIYENIPSWTDGYIYEFNYINFANREQKLFYNTFKQFFFEGKYIDLKGYNNYAFVLLFDLIENYNDNLLFLEQQVSFLTNYYPNTKITGHNLLCKTIENNGDFEFAWNSILNGEYISIQKIIEYSNKLNKELLTGDLLFKIAGCSYLSSFGQKNIDEIKPFAEIGLENYKREKNCCNFFDLFVHNGSPIKSKKTIIKSVTKKIFGFFENHTYDTIFEYTPDYYKAFFLFEEEFESYKRLDESQIESGFIKDINSHFPHVVEKSIINQCRLIIKQAEDLYRVSIGMPKIGEGWISETELFYKISNIFIDEEVKQHASPKWLGKQHLDIYFPKWQIAIEYQGAQHFKPIDFFGGQEAYIRTVERDERKMNLCQKHNCYLIYVEEGYDINEIIEMIENRINYIKQTNNKL